MNINTITNTLQQQSTFDASPLTLQSGGFTIRVISNSEKLIQYLRDYFNPYLIESDAIDLTVKAIDSDIVELPFPFKDWPREAGKSGRKDAYYDFPCGRLIRKVRTGMLFLQSEQERIAAGPCLQHPNQVINFINSQAMNRLQQQDWLICHAAAIEVDNKAIAIAGFSGGGKSTLMLHLLEWQHSRFVTNDRLFIRRDEHTVEAIGIAKLPRINPGTIVNNPRLHSLIPAPQRQRLLELPKQELWQLEDKYDVDIAECYDPDRIAIQAPLQTFIVLNWRHDSEQATTAKPVDLSERRDLLAALIKSPGPFYQDADGHFLAENTLADERRYLSVLAGVTIFEVTGRVDFKALQQFFDGNLF